MSEKILSALKHIEEYEGCDDIPKAHPDNIKLVKEFLIPLMENNNIKDPVVTLSSDGTITAVWNRNNTVGRQGARLILTFGVEDLFPMYVSFKYYGIAVRDVQRYLKQDLKWNEDEFKDSLNYLKEHFSKD